MPALAPVTRAHFPDQVVMVCLEKTGGSVSRPGCTPCSVVRAPCSLRKETRPANGLDLRSRGDLEERAEGYRGSTPGVLWKCGFQKSYGRDFRKCGFYWSYKSFVFRTSACVCKCRRQRSCGRNGGAVSALESADRRGWRKCGFQRSYRSDCYKCGLQRGWEEGACDRRDEILNSHTFIAYISNIVKRNLKGIPSSSLCKFWEGLGFPGAVEVREHAALNSCWKRVWDEGKTAP
jgi:hypothetical protein